MKKRMKEKRWKEREFTERGYVVCRWVITPRPGALLEIFKFFHTVAVRPIITIHYFCDWGRLHI